MTGQGLFGLLYTIVSTIFLRSILTFLLVGSPLAPLHACQRDVRWEEQGESGQDEDSNNNGREVFLFFPISGGDLAVALRRLIVPGARLVVARTGLIVARAGLIVAGARSGGRIAASSGITAERRGLRRMTVTPGASVVVAATAAVSALEGRGRINGQGADGERHHDGARRFHEHSLT